MEHTFEELKKKRVAELREIAKEIEHEAVKGYTQLNKEHLLAAVCEALGIDMHEHHVVKDAHKPAMKAEIKRQKELRDKAAAAKDRGALHNAQKKIRKLKRTLRKLAV